jgi:hypothetical protein
MVSQSAKPTEKTLKQKQKLLDYLATLEDAVYCHIMPAK